MQIKSILGSILVILGIILILFACYAFLADGRMLVGLSVGKAEALAPFLIGALFLGAGVAMFRQGSAGPGGKLN
jgi:threonine/homoserine/homoserine lactone efflux protein